MKKIQRYGRNGGDLEPLTNGEWVRWEDYKSLQSHIKRITHAGDDLYHLIYEELPSHEKCSVMKTWEEETDETSDPPPPSN